MKRPEPKKPKREPWHPAPWDNYDANAVRAVANGLASEAQQKRAAKWIIETLCQTYGEPFYPDSQRVTDYMLGRRSVGREIVKLINVKISLVEKGENA